LYKGTLSGYSRSKDLIKNIDYLLLSMGICCSIRNNGEEIRVSTKDDVRELCKYTKRLQFNENFYKRNTSYASPTMTKINKGWAVNINGINLKDKNTVYSIETKSHKYIANLLLTHNCFPKDVLAFITWAKEQNYDLEILETVHSSNTKVRGKLKNGATT